MFFWQTGYGAFSVSQSQVQRVLRYIQEQERHHRNQPFDRGRVELFEVAAQVRLYQEAAVGEGQRGDLGQPGAGRRP